MSKRVTINDSILKDAESSVRKTLSEAYGKPPRDEVVKTVARQLAASIPQPKVSEPTRND